MADFIQNAQTKKAVRELASPIADVTVFNLIVQSVIIYNPLAYTAYGAGPSHHEADHPIVLLNSAPES